MPLPADDAIIQGLMRFWEQARGARPMPAKSDMDPVRLGARLLPHILLVETVEGGTRFRYRLCGSANTDAAGMDLTGRHVDELNPHPDYIRYMVGLYRQAQASGRPVYSESRYLALATNTARDTRRLICPLSSDGATVDNFISAQTFQHVGAERAPPIAAGDRFEPRTVEVL